MIVPLRRRLWAVMIVVGLLATVGGWWSLGPAAPHGGIPAAVADASRTASTPMDARLPAGGGATPASAVAELHAAHEPAAASSRERVRAELKQRMQADWCGFSAAEQRRHEIEAARFGTSDLAAFHEAADTVGEEILKDATAQVRQRWVAALLQRGDPRSVAVAEHLGGRDGDDAKARAQLQALARTSADPMVTVLALQRPCAAGACRNVERAQWARLEPANLQAWLTLLEGPAAPRMLESYALDRMAGEARYSRSYEREYQALLLSLPQSAVPGPMQEAELQFIAGAVSALPMASLRPVIEACTVHAGEPSMQQRCAAVAEVMWQADHLIDRYLSMALVRRLSAARPELKVQWMPRARELEALRRWVEHSADRPASAVPEVASPCAWQGEMRRDLQGKVAQGEWAWTRAEMQAADADDAALSAKWRQATGRGLLDPVPPPQPSSAARRGSAG